MIHTSRSVLGSQLLACSDYDCERAIRTMELLKLRFGEPAMHACEVCGSVAMLMYRGQHCL